MKIFFDELRFSSKKGFELIAITEGVKECVKKSGIKNGHAIVYTQHTTGSVRVSEDEISLHDDYAAFLDKLAPRSGSYKHDITNVDGRKNGHAHLQSMLLNSNETILIKDGKLLLGAWQTVFFIELDGPRPERKVIIQVVGE
ncbi:MAG: secondary thiamine-phosphate synthase enzyme YjbQ [Candidatus Micrarchaeaceae archaeon]